MTTAPVAWVATALVIIFLGAAVARIGRKYRVPSVLSLLLLGIVFRIFLESLGLIEVESLLSYVHSFAGFGLMIIALIVVLFVGGLETELADFVRAINPGLLMATVGAATTVILTGLIGSVVLKLPLLFALLIGAVIVPTDPTTIYPLLDRLKLKRKVRDLLRTECVLDDPMVIALAFGFVELILHPEMRPLSIVKFFFWQLGVGIAIGLLVGYATGFALTRITKRPIEMTVLSLAIPVTAFALAEWVEASGFIATLFAGLLLGNSRKSPASFIPSIGRLPRERLLDFWSGAEFLLETVLFIAMGMMIDLTRFGPMLLSGVLLTIIVVGVSRPTSLFLTTAFDKRLDNKDRIFMTWAGMRATTPAILAFAVSSMIPEAGFIVDLTLAAIVVAAVVQGVGVNLLANRFGLFKSP